MNNKIIAVSPVVRFVEVPEIYDPEAACERNAQALARGVAAWKFELYAFVLKHSNAGDQEARRLVALCNTEPPAFIETDIPF